LGGGMNAYGFAGGDRVNFSDPLGLSPCCEVELEGIAEAARNAGPMVTVAAAATGLVAGAPAVLFAGAVGGVVIADRLLGGNPSTFEPSEFAPSDATAVEASRGRRQGAREIPDSRQPHEKGTSPSTREKHEDTRNPSTDKKRQHDKWEQNPNKKPPG
jgi:hypothetical protein